MYDFNLVQGDILRRRKGNVWHWGVWLQEGVLHNTPDKGEHISSLGEFSNGNEIEIFQPNDLNRNDIIARAYNIINNPSEYQYLWRNCEHTVTEITSGKPSSQTVNNLAIAALMLCSIYIVIRCKAK